MILKVSKYNKRNLKLHNIEFENLEYSRHTMYFVSPCSRHVSLSLIEVNTTYI